MEEKWSWLPSEGDGKSSKALVWGKDIWGAECGRWSHWKCGGEGRQSAARWRPSLITPELSGGQSCVRLGVSRSALLFSALGAGKCCCCWWVSGLSLSNVPPAEGSRSPLPLMWKCQQYIEWIPESLPGENTQHRRPPRNTHVGLSKQRDGDEGKTEWRKNEISPPTQKDINLNYGSPHQSNMWSLTRALLVLEEWLSADIRPYPLTAHACTWGPLESGCYPSNLEIGNILARLPSSFTLLKDYKISRTYARGQELNLSSLLAIWPWASMLISGQQ